MLDEEYKDHGHMKVDNPNVLIILLINFPVSSVNLISLVDTLIHGVY